jgi:hypothetical protein
MTAIRTALRRLIATAAPADEGVHFHRRSHVTEPCYDPACRLPRAEV